MAIENVQQLLTEQLGKNRCDVILTDNMTSKDYYCIHFPIESVILSIAADNVIEGGGSGVGNLNGKTMPAGTSIFLNVTQFQLTSGLALCYYEQPL
jgi:ribose 5-phosphate isomerase RpiB